MIDFCEMLRNSDNGQALDRLAEQFHLSKDEANAAVEAVMPALSAGLTSKWTDPAGLFSLLGEFGEGRPLAAFASPGTGPAAPAEAGAEALRLMLGSDPAGNELALRAAATTGLSPGLLNQMLPVIASMLVGAITNALQSRGLGGILSELAKAAGPGGLGSILGQILGGARGPAGQVPPQAPPSGPGGGIDLGTILEQIATGGRGQAGPVPPQGSPTGPGGGMDLGRILEQILGGARGEAGPVPPQGSPTGPGGGMDLGTILEQILGGAGGPARRAEPPAETSRPRGGLADEIGDMLGGKRT